LIDGDGPKCDNVSDHPPVGAVAGRAWRLAAAVVPVV